MMYYSLSENHPYLVEMPEPVHVREIIQEIVNDIRRRHEARTVTLDDLKRQIRERRICATVMVGS